MTMEPNHNGYPRIPIFAVSGLGAMALIGITLVCIVRPESASVLTTLISGCAIAIIGFVMVLAGQKQIIVQSNSIVQSLVAAAEKISFAAGVAAEKRAEEKREEENLECKTSRSKA